MPDQTAAVPKTDGSLRELNAHGTFELPVETYADNCAIFHSLYNHWHNEMEILCVEEGRGFLRLNRETLSIKAGDILIVNSGVLHGIQTDLEDILSYRSIVFSLSFLSSPAGDLCQEQVIAPLLEKRAQVACRIAPEDRYYGGIRRLFGQLHRCHSQERGTDPYYFVKLKALFYDLFYEMLSGNYIVPAVRERNQNLAAIKTVLDYINLHYPENLSARELAALSNFSETYFMKRFRQYTGKTLIEYLNGFRMDKAKALLVHTDAPVTEIATQVGFNNTSYFIKKFQQANGVSPSRFRRNLP